MEPSPGVVQLLYALATVVSGGLLWWVWTERDRRGGKPLILALVGAVIWCVAPLAGTVVESSTHSLLAYRVLFIGVGIGVLGLFVFTLEFTGREHWIRPRILGLLAIEPTLLVIFAFSNPGNLFFRSVTSDASAWGIAVSWGPAFWIHAVYSFVLLAVGSFFVLGFLTRSRTIYRGQAAALLLGTLFPWIGSLVHLVGPLSFNSTPLGIAIGIGFFAIAILQYGLIDVEPVARDRVFETISDLVLVVDRQERVLDANPAIRSLIGRQGQQITGETLSEFFSETPEVVDHYRETITAGTEAEFEIAVAGREYAGQVSPITDGLDRHVAWLIVGHDVTEQKRRRRTLQRRNEQLDQFASIVSHDLRNPLNVAAGRLELARDECDSEHLHHVAEAHDRMETIVDDTLTLARLGETVAELEVVNLGAVLDSWWAGVETGSATLQTPGELRIRGDPERLRHVFENLFRNAVTHGLPDEVSPGSSLTVTVDRCGPDCISIADDGVGLAEGVAVFESGATTNNEGTGLGLAIVEKIVTAHGWEITAGESATGGAKFEITGIDVV